MNIKATGELKITRGPVTWRLKLDETGMVEEIEDVQGPTFDVPQSVLFLITVLVQELVKVNGVTL
jgi:hypothetical protein